MEMLNMYSFRELLRMLLILIRVFSQELHCCPSSSAEHKKYEAINFLQFSNKFTERRNVHWVWSVSFQVLFSQQ